MITMRLKRILSAFCAIVVLVSCACVPIGFFVENNLTASATTNDRASMYDECGYDYVVLSNDECEYRLYYDLQNDGIHLVGMTGDVSDKVSGIIEIPATINGIDVVSIDYGLSDCDVTEFIIPNTVTYIGEAAFSGNQKLYSITIPDSVTYMGQDVFYEDYSLNTIYYGGTRQEWRLLFGVEFLYDCSSYIKVYFCGNDCECYYDGLPENAAIPSVTVPIDETSETTTTTTDTIDSSIKLGDIDGDNEITSTDAYMCLVAYVNMQLGLSTGMSSEQLTAADVNGDGTVDVMDSYYMLCYYAEVQLRGVAAWSDILSRY